MDYERISAKRFVDAAMEPGNLTDLTATFPRKMARRFDFEKYLLFDEVPAEVVKARNPIGASALRTGHETASAEDLASGRSVGGLICVAVEQDGLVRMAVVRDVDDYYLVAVLTQEPGVYNSWSHYCCDQWPGLEALLEELGMG